MRSFAGAPAIAEQAHVYQGRRCLRGHDGLRYSTSRNCVYCTRERAVAARRVAKMRLATEVDIDA